MLPRALSWETCADSRLVCCEGVKEGRRRSAKRIAVLICWIYGDNEQCDRLLYVVAEPPIRGIDDGEMTMAAMRTCELLERMEMLEEVVNWVFGVNSGTGNGPRAKHYVGVLLLDMIVRLRSLAMEVKIAFTYSKSIMHLIVGKL